MKFLSALSIIAGFCCFSLSGMGATCSSDETQELVAQSAAMGAYLSQLHHSAFGGLDSEATLLTSCADSVVCYGVDIRDAVSHTTRRYSVAIDIFNCLPYSVTAAQIVLE